MRKLLTILLLVGVLYGQSDTLTFKVKGLVCSFCAHGLNKGIGKLPFTSEDGVLVDIKNQTVKVALNEDFDAMIHLRYAMDVIHKSGYEVNKVFLNGDELK